SSSVTSGQVPRYAATQLPTTPLTVVVIAPSTTTMLVPFASDNGGFDTGIAVSNTTSDPYGPTLGGAVPQDGSLTFTFFPLTGGSFSVVSTATGFPIGNNKLTNSVLKTKNTYSVLLSQLLTFAGKPANFSGYIFIVSNFTNGH